jgi:hypothetical protein
MTIDAISPELLSEFRTGCVIPAMPLALKADGQFDTVSQAAVLRYYLDAGVGGIAVGVHSTQFEIRDIPGFFPQLLSFASRVIDEHTSKTGRSVLKISGICGRTDQARAEAELAAGSGYQAGLLSLTALADRDEGELIQHVRRIAGTIPVIGFCLQKAVGGRRLSCDFWREFSRLDNVLGIKIAPFDRYATLDVVRGVAESGRSGEITLYTGNDDNIIVDLLTPFRITDSRGMVRELKIRGGLLGHWGVWTASAVELFRRIHRLAESREPITPDILTLAQEVTDMNAAVFDPANGFAGCIPGIQEVLRRQGLLESSRTLNPREVLSPGQAGEIDRVCRDYPHLVDDEFIHARIGGWRR